MAISENYTTLHNGKQTGNQGGLRDEMPITATFIDTMRATFGASGIDAAIRSGMKGQPSFWACENGREVGTKRAESTCYTRGDQLNLEPKKKQEARS